MVNHGNTKNYQQNQNYSNDDGDKGVGKRYVMRWTTRCLDTLNKTLHYDMFTRTAFFYCNYMFNTRFVLIFHFSMATRTSAPDSYDSYNFSKFRPNILTQFNIRECEKSCPVIMKKTIDISWVMWRCQNFPSHSLQLNEKIAKTYQFICDLIWRRCKLWTLNNCPIKPKQNWHPCK